jgi:hypothetical protein
MCVSYPYRMDDALGSISFLHDFGVGGFVSGEKSVTRHGNVGGAGGGDLRAVRFSSLWWLWGIINIVPMWQSWTRTTLCSRSRMMFSVCDQDERA